MKQFLQGIKVVGFETAGAGPAASKLLAEYGADVIVIEPITGMNTRVTPSFEFYFLHKKSIAINMKTPEGLALVHKLLSDADVFVTNYRKRAVDKFGLDYETLHEKYPRLIHASLTGYGENGPMKDAPGFDTTAYWGRAGLAKCLREKDGDPIVTPSAIGDIGTGTMLAGGIMGALYHRERTGEAMKVYISLYNTGIYQNNEQMFFTQRGFTYPQSRLTPRRAYANTYILKDGYFHFHTIDPMRDMPKVMHVIGRDDLIDDPRFAGHWKDDGQTAYELRKVMDEGFSKLTIAETKQRFAEQDIAFGEICGPDDVLKDPQAEANQLLFEHTLLSGEKIIFPASPIKFMDDTPSTDTPVPLVGENTVEIMKQYGYSDEEIQTLIEQKVVRAESRQG